MAIAGQNADGSFVRHPDGRLMVFEQSFALHLTCLILTDGSTPQGVYRIQGTAVSNNKLIGLLPNLQMLLCRLREVTGPAFYMPVNSVVDMLNPYLRFFPPPGVCIHR